VSIYRGTRWARAVAVRVDYHPLPPRNDLFNHSPNGFEWGYRGSGPAQLALAILAHHTRDDGRAVRLHQIFKDDIIALLDKDYWEIDSVLVDRWLEIRDGDAPLPAA